MSSSVLNFERLLAPIPGENPAGKNLKGEMIVYDKKELTYYDAIAAARPAVSDAPDQDDGNRSSKTANWSEVIRLVTEALATKSKDLRLAAQMTEALVNQHGFAGLRDGLRLLWELQNRFWLYLHPGVEDGGFDPGYRKGPLEWLDAELPASIARVPIVQSEDKSYSWWDWDSAWTRASDSGVTTKQFDDAKAATPRAYYEELFEDLHQSLQEYEQLDHIVEEKFREVYLAEAYLAEVLDNEGLDPNNEKDRKKAVSLAQGEIPTLSAIKKAIENCYTLAEQIVEEKRKLEPDPEPSKQAQSKQIEKGLTSREEQPLVPSTISSLGSLPLTPQSRADALQRLKAVADYFHKTEPHSPVSYLIERAIRWGEMPLDKWLQDVIREENILAQLRETLGLKNTQESQ